MQRRAPGASPSPTLPGPLRVRPAGEVRPARSLCLARDPRSPASEQYRLLRFKLKERFDPRIIGITSPLAGEGKTTAAANLGLALAEGKRARVLLLDLNLRNPCLSSLFGILSPGSIPDQLLRRRRDSRAPWEILELGSSIHLMGGVTPCEHPAALLGSEEVPLLIADLAEHYDYVVVDLPAVLPSADVKMIEEQLDGIVLICRAEQSTRTAVSSAIAQLNANKIRGVVMMAAVEVPRTP
jgi:protein-tyrosine kinase